MARILITSGPTREPIDPVRFIANASSGRMGAALARVALARGHAVTVVSGPAEIILPGGAEVVPVTTALEMLEATRSRHPDCDVLIGAAAVSDYRPRSPEVRKRPRDAEAWRLELVPNPDLLAELGRERRDGQIHVGFALETSGPAEARRRAGEKLERKGLDWIVLNSARAIGAEEEEYCLLPREGAVIELGRISKSDLAGALFDRLGL